MRAVNLLPGSGRSASRGLAQERIPAYVGAVTGALIVAILAGEYLVQSSKVSDAQQQLDAAKVQLASTPLPPPPPKIAPLPVETEPAVVTSEQQPMLQALSAALSQRIAWDRILREFSLVLPNDVWLSALTMSAPVPTTDGSTPLGTLTISATTYSYDSVARFLSRMQLIPDLTGVNLSTTSASNNLVQFSVAASVKGAPATPVAPAVPTTTDTTSTSTTGSGA